jgi:hypothetical protein
MIRGKDDFTGRIIFAMTIAPKFVVVLIIGLLFSSTEMYRQTRNDIQTMIMCKKSKFE